jgi:uncharacterized damage-inducible protein DinB
MSEPFPEPTRPVGSRAEVFVGYLDFFRSTVLEKVRALPERALRRSQLPSGWTPVELVKHLTFVEMRWLEWGFAGREVAEPWGDSRHERWHVDDEESLTQLTSALAAQGIRSRDVIASHDLSEIGQPGPRWDGADPPTLERILFHLLQEYARHVGHLDIVVELAVGALGE